jgi:DNA-binding winged helix-turn-helix (wHTH) protein
MPDRPSEVYEFGEFQLDVGQRTLERRQGHERIAIPEKAFRTLVHLVRNSGALVTRDAILSTVWSDVLVEEGNIGKVIYLIRTALGDRNGAGAYIETVPKHGYRLVVDVTRVQKTAMASEGHSAAYDLYIRGKVKVGSENADDNDEAISLLESAVGLDPSCAGAYAQLARAYNTRSFKFTHGKTESAFARTPTSRWQRRWIWTHTWPRRTSPAASFCGPRLKGFRTSRPSDRSRKPSTSTPTPTKRIISCRWCIRT